jgi:hypothetical protein
MQNKVVFFFYFHFDIFIFENKVARNNAIRRAICLFPGCCGMPWGNQKYFIEIPSFGKELFNSQLQHDIFGKNST